MFEKASRLKIRFDTPQGSLLVEDLWDLPLSNSRNRANLDDIAKGLFKQLKESETASFVVKAPKKDEALQLKFDIIKHIIDIRLAEAEAAEMLRANKEKKQKLLALIDEKENAILTDKSLDELKEMAKNL